MQAPTPITKPDATRRRSISVQYHRIAMCRSRAFQFNYAHGLGAVNATPHRLPTNRRRQVPCKRIAKAPQTGLAAKNRGTVKATGTLSRQPEPSPGRSGRSFSTTALSCDRTTIACGYISDRTATGRRLLRRTVCACFRGKWRATLRRGRASKLYVNWKATLRRGRASNAGGRDRRASLQVVAVRG